MSTVPVMQLAAGEATNRHEFAMSTLCPPLCRGMMSPIDAPSAPLGVSLSKPSVPSMAPGQTPMTLMPLGPSSTARCLVRASTPALAVPAWDCKAVPLQCRCAVMLMMTPPFFMACWVVYFDSRKVPTVSIMSTVLKALGERSWQGARKLPAAPLTKTSISPNLATTSLTVASTLSSFRTSQELPVISFDPVSALRLATALLMLSILREMMCTVAPCFRNSLTISQQIPVAPPDTKTTFPLQRSSLNTDVIRNIISSTALQSIIRSCSITQIRVLRPNFFSMRFCSF